MWSNEYNKTYLGGPRASGSWISFARSHGKKLSLPEWAVWNDAHGGDNPLFIEKMHDTFKANAG